MENIEISSENNNNSEKQKAWKNFLKMYLVLAILFLIMFAMRSTVTILQVYVPDISATFAMTEGRIAIIFTIYNLTAALFSLFVGPITERVGYKVIMYTGMFTYAIAIGLSALAVQFWMLALAQSIGGIGASFFGPATIAYAGDYFPKEKISTAIGLIMSSFYVATIVAVPINTYIAELLNWQWAVGVMAILSLLVFILIIMIVPRIKEKKIESTESKTDENEQVEIKEENNLNYFVRMKLVLQNKYAVGTFFITLFQRGGLFAMTTLLSTWLARDGFWNGHFLGLDKSQTGLVLMGTGIAALISNTIFSWAADRIGKRTIILMGTGLTGIAITVFPVLAEVYHNLNIAIIGFIVVNFFGGISMGSYNAFVTEVAPKSKGTSVAINNAFGQIGLAIAVALIARLVWDKTLNYAYCAFVALGFYIITTILMFVIVRPKKIQENASKAN
ncbi:MAG: MFS transporter [Candidatus Heimdallarchaeota archaeon]